MPSRRGQHDHRGCRYGKRQQYQPALVALTSTIGQAKTSVLTQRLLDINPDLQLRTVGEFIKDEATYTLLDSEPYTYVVDAIDTLSPKAHLIKGCLDRGIPVVSSMGAGAKTDPTKVEIEDIARTHHCPLAHMLRKRLHKMGIHTGFQAVFSAEKIREGAMIIDEQTNKKPTRAPSPTCRPFSAAAVHRWLSATL